MDTATAQTQIQTESDRHGNIGDQGGKEKLKEEIIHQHGGVGA